MAFQRATDGFVHAASGEILGLFVYVFNRLFDGVNIIALTRSGGSWELETVSAPFVRHSHKISVKHPKVSGEFEVSKVVSSTSENGFIRTKIYF